MSDFASIVGKHLPPASNTMLLAANNAGAQDGYILMDDVLSFSGFLSASEIQALVAIPYVLIKDAKGGGDGGTLTQGVSNQRDLNAVEVDTHNLCVLANNTFTLAAGTWRIRASCPAFQVGRHNVVLQYAEFGVILGTSAYSYNPETVSGVVTRSEIVGTFDSDPGYACKLLHFGEATKLNTGLGVHALPGLDSIYSVVELWRVA